MTDYPAFAARKIESRGHTLCEVYRGFAISTLTGLFHAHDAEGFLMAFPATETRAAMRARIDWRLD